MTLDIVLLQGLRRGVFLMSEVPLYVHEYTAFQAAVSFCSPLQSEEDTTQKV